MKVLVSVLLSMVSCVVTFRQPKEIAQRRQQFVGYVNNVVHENPIYPDQAAQSSVKVNFNSNQPDQRQQIYASNPYQQQDLPYTSNQPTNAPQSQLFNVGYSVRFTNGNRPSKPPPTKYTRSNNLENAEIITGTRKQNEEVQGPQINNSDDFISISAISNKKHKISGIKPKPSQVVTNFPNPKVLLSQAYLSPTTQKYYKALEQVKPQTQNNQDLQLKYSWRNLSRGVEIVKSTEVPTAKYTRTTFDHAKALGRSQDFDQSNAVESTAPQQQNVFYYTNPRKTQTPEYQQIPIVVASQPQVPKYPIDTSLLREQIPVQVDARFLNDEMNQLALYANTKYPQQENREVNYLQQAYRTIPVPEGSLIRPVQVLYQQEPDHQPEQSRFQYKIYGKPQPISTLVNTQADEPVIRQPRFSSDVYTNLRPPPFNVAYQRRIRVY